MLIAKQFPINFKTTLRYYSHGLIIRYHFGNVNGQLFSEAIRKLQDNKLHTR